MDDGAAYHTLKYTTQFCQEAGLFYMIWLIQSSKLNPIENFWRLLNLWVSKRHHQICIVEEMKDTMKKEWE